MRIAIALALLATSSMAAAVDDILPTGQRITPLAAPGSSMIALDPALADMPTLRLGWATNAVLSPDRTRLAIITSGTNSLLNAKGGPVSPKAFGDYIVIYDVTGPTPRRTATLAISASYGGIVWSADGQKLYAALGVFDSVQAFARTGDDWAPAGAPIKLGHKVGIGIGTAPLAAGVALFDGGGKLAVANRHNDSISIVDLATASVREIDLRPGGGKAGGTSPYWIAATGKTLWVTSQRDRELVEVDPAAGRVLRRVALKGVPNRVITDRAGKRLFVTEDNADLVEIIDAAKGVVAQAVPTLPNTPTRPRGATPTSLTLSGDERTLYATNGGTNAVAVISLTGPKPRLTGLIPTGWYPAAVAWTPKRLFVLDTKGQAGPNRGWCAQTSRMKQQGDCAKPGVGRASNDYILQLVRSHLLTIPIPSAKTLATLTPRALANARIGAAASRADTLRMAELRKRIKHVIYIVKENRTYDQVLGDLPRGNGDPSIAQFGRALTPNQHALAEQFVTLDDFRVSGEVSGDGWQWSTAARATDVNEQLTHTYYAAKGGSYDSEGTERNVVVSGNKAARRAAHPQVDEDDDRLAGNRNAAEVDGPEDERGLGYLWDAAHRAGKSVRNYGFFLDLTRYDLPADKGGIPPIEDPFASKTPVAVVASQFLTPLTDPYFRGFDSQLPDFFRFKEWQREFAGFEAKGAMPALSFVRFMNDHMGAFDKAIRGVNTPETQQADNDYAVGLLVEAIAKSKFAKDTLVFVLEDDAQDGPDHVDAHRSIAFVAGPYVKQGAVISTRYTTVDMIRTIEAVLGLKPNNLFDGGARPMADLFDLTQGPGWSFKATPADILYSTQLPLPPRTTAGPIALPRHDAAWWAAETRDFDWSSEDKNDAAAFNAVLAKGLSTGQ
ncbi:MAG: bifunctional YncE family protein/alkaline phosphatase family protein [Sphingomonas sp.]|uniref:bifunctional YncE family protein/alkaline phosphatase family protein n=1 Tax=Sphingomonas sp. TaxID=28214 RepID=UPI0025EB2CCA|nr:bifunctional YncE family protein/alkaline phosphatase family protein [Sphingomonas sp.]MBY0283939.1 bifunctional YncE family protein/alkaline phosphatase family protein [Sphingomonas sp.]